MGLSINCRHVYSRVQLLALRPRPRYGTLLGDVTDKVQTLGVRRHVRGNRAGRKVGLSIWRLRPIPVLSLVRPLCKHNDQLIASPKTALPAPPSSRPNLVEVPLQSVSSIPTIVGHRPRPAVSDESARVRRRVLRSLLRTSSGQTAQFFKVGVFNAQSATNKAASITDWISSERLSLVAVTETWHDGFDSPS